MLERAGDGEVLDRRALGAALDDLLRDRRLDLVGIDAEPIEPAVEGLVLAAVQRLLAEKPSHLRKQAWVFHLRRETRAPRP